MHAKWLVNKANRAASGIIQKGDTKGPRDMRQMSVKIALNSNLWYNEALNIDALAMLQTSKGSEHNLIGKEGYAMDSLPQKSPRAYVSQNIRANKISQFHVGHRPTETTPTEEQIILGSLLGDGYLSVPGLTPFYAEVKTEEHIAYLRWKANALCRLDVDSNRDIRAVKNRHAVCLTTRSLPAFIPYHVLFYATGTKRVTEEMLSRVGPLGLAVWYMDDGNISFHRSDPSRYSTPFSLKGHARLSTCGFDESEHCLMSNWFQAQWGITPSIHSQRTRIGHIVWFLDFGVKQTEHLLSIINPYIHPIMAYKASRDHWIERYMARQEKRRELL